MRSIKYAILLGDFIHIIVLSIFLLNEILGPVFIQIGNVLRMLGFVKRLIELPRLIWEGVLLKLTGLILQKVLFLVRTLLLPQNFLELAGVASLIVVFFQQITENFFEKIVVSVFPYEN